MILNLLWSYDCEITTLVNWVCMKDYNSCYLYYIYGCLLLFVAVMTLTKQLFELSQRLTNGTLIIVVLYIQYQYHLRICTYCDNKANYTYVLQNNFYSCASHQTAKCYGLYKTYIKCPIIQVLLHAIIENIN